MDVSKWEYFISCFWEIWIHRLSMGLIECYYSVASSSFTLPELTIRPTEFTENKELYCKKDVSLDWLQALASQLERMRNCAEAVSATKYDMRNLQQKIWF